MEIVEDDGAWVASIPDLPGCNSFGDTVPDAIEGLQKTKSLWLEGQYKAGADIPEPESEDDFSGKFVLRIPKTLHRSLAYQAKKQGVSLNHYASHLLSQRQPLATFEHAAKTLLDVCANSPAQWFYGRWHDRAMVMGRLNANTDMLVVLRKPPARGAFKTSVSANLRKQYLLPESR